MTPIKKRSTRPMVTSAALLGVLMLAGCGSSAPATTQDTDAPTRTDAPATTTETSAPATGDGGGEVAGNVDLCAVLTLAEVSAAAGVEAVGATSANAMEVSSCNYNAADGKPVAGNTYTRGNEAIDPTQMLEANAGEGEEIPDLGDRAVLVGDDDFPILMVLKGGALYSISVLADGLDAAGKRQATIDLARLSLDRLP